MLSSEKSDIISNELIRATVTVFAMQPNFRNRIHKVSGRIEFNLSSLIHKFIRVEGSGIEMIQWLQIRCYDNLFVE